MDIDDYVQSGETVYCRTKTKKGNPENETEGTLVCTDSRLLFFKKRSVVDIDLHSIQEIEFFERYISWKHVAWAIISFLAGAFLWQFDTAISEIPNGLGGPALIFGMIVSLVYVVIVFLLWKPTLEVSTGLETRKFRGGELEEIPHAIRGASR